MIDLTWRVVAISPVAELLAAVAFLTRIPVVVPGPDARTGAAAFGLVGSGLGLAAAAPIVLLAPAHPLLAAILAVAVLAILSGGLHLDGLADTADALSAPPGAAERARTDPRAGTAGVVAVVLVLGLQVAALAEVAARSAPVAVAVVVGAVTLSRAAAPVWALTVGVAFGPAEGLGRWFAQSTSALAAAGPVLTGVAVVVAAGVLVGWSAAIAAIAGLVVAALVGLVIVRLRGQLDGDGYGALVEITLASILLAAATVG